MYATKTRFRRFARRGPKLSAEQREAQSREALQRCMRDEPGANDAHVVAEFSSRGIPADDIFTFGDDQNVYTYAAWHALGRQVCKGEHGVRVTTWIPIDGEHSADGTDTGSKDDGKTRGKMRPVTAVVFHVSQTDERKG